MLWDVVQRALVWILTWEIFGIIAGIFGPFGAIALVIGVLLLMHKATSDRFMVQRWRRKFRNWRGR